MNKSPCWLIPVDPQNETHLRFLYELLAARPVIAAVSHKKMPSFEEHCEFVRNHPYADWCLIAQDHRDRYNSSCGGHDDPKGDNLTFVGSVFLSQPARPSVVGDELSVDMNADWRGKGYAERALRMMMEKHGPRRYIANVGHENYASMALFQKLGFKLCQVTFELVPQPPKVIWRNA